MGKLFRNKFFVALLMMLSIGSAVNANAQKSKFPSMKQLAASATQQIKTGHTISCAPKAKAPGANAEVLFDEDFSAFTEGSDEQLGENVTAGYNDGDPYIDPKYVHGQSGWWGVGVYSAGGMVALAYPNFGGVINTPKREMYGRLHVSFRVKVRSGNPSTWQAPVIVNCCKGTNASPSIVNDIPTNNLGSCTYQLGYYTSDGWQQVELDMYNPSHGDDSWIQIHCATYAPAGYLIDDFKVTRDYDFAMAPENIQSTDFTDDGLTVSWTPGAENKYSLFSLIEHKTTGKSPRTVNETFANATTDKSGNVDLSSLTDDSWHLSLGKAGSQLKTNDNGSKALVIDEPTDTIVTPSHGGHIEKISLGLSAIYGSNSYGALMIDGWDGFKWENVTYKYFMELSDAPTQIDVQPSEGSIQKYTKLRLYTVDLNDGDQVMLSSVNAELMPDVTVSKLMTDVKTENSYIVLHDLDPNAEYFYSLTGCKDDNIKSAPTDWTHALGCPAPKVDEATNVSENSYTANWEESPKAVMYDVKNYKATEIKENTADYPVLVDNFTNAKTEDGKVVVSDETSFDAYTDNKGWTATAYGLLYDKALGICSLGTLYSPEMTLNNNNGKFKVHLKLRGYNGAMLAVQSVNTYGVVELKTTGTEKFTAQADTTLTFEDGKAAERLMFYACGANMQGVVIESIEVTQDVEAGNHVYQLEGRNILNVGTTSYDFGNLTSDNYAYTVTAKGNYYGENYSSVPSAYQAVSLKTTAISGMPASNGSALRIAGINGNMITVSTDGSKKIMVYDISGNLCQTVNATAGETTLSVGGTGVYVVTDGTDAYKVTVK